MHSAPTSEQVSTRKKDLCMPENVSPTLVAEVSSQNTLSTVFQEETIVHGTRCTYPPITRHVLQHLPDAEAAWTHVGSSWNLDLHR